MRRFDDAIIQCPFDKAHKMPSARLQWHLASCKTKKARIEQQLPILHCANNYYHIFLDQADLDAHTEACDSKLKITETEWVPEADFAVVSTSPETTPDSAETPDGDDCGEQAAAEFN